MIVKENNIIIYYKMVLSILNSAKIALLMPFPLLKVSNGIKTCPCSLWHRTLFPSNCFGQAHNFAKPFGG